MDDIVAALAEQQTELAAILAGLDEADFERPSRCDGWSVSDVVLHVAQTNDMAIASASGRFGEFMTEMASLVGSATDVDDGAARMVERERGATGADIRTRYVEGAQRLLDLLDESDPHQRVDWVAGQLAIRTLTTTRLAETWIHTGDVADAVGLELPLAKRHKLIARLAWRTLPYAFARAGRELHGPVAFHLTGPDGAAWDFDPDEAAVTTIEGDAHELCLVAARRVDPSATGLRGEGPDASDVLDLVRTYA